MRVLNLLLLIFLFTCGAAAQTPSRYPDSPGVTVVKKSWRVRVVDTSASGDPLRAGGERLEEEAVQRQIKEDIERSGATTTPWPRPQVRWNTPRATTRAVQYIFEAEIKNTGAKRVRGVVWEYVFLDAAGVRELGYRPFASKVNVGPGGSARLIGRLTKIVGTAAELKEARKTADRARGKFPELISICRIEYDDGSVWERPR